MTTTAVTRARRGTTLPSLLVGLALTTLVGALLGGATVALLRVAHRQQARLRVRAQLAHAADVLAWELRDLAPVPTATDLGDLLLVADTALELRATVGGGVACAASPYTVELAHALAPGAPDASWWTDAPQSGDVAHLHDEGPLPTWRDDAWHARTIVDVERTTAACVATPWRGAGSHWRLTLGGAPLPVTVGAGAPVRLSRRRRYVHYRDGDGHWQLGQRSWAGGAPTLQPVAGPLSAPSDELPGLLVDAWDRAGATADGATPHDVARLRVRVHATTGAGRARRGDSLLVHAPLDMRNVP